MSNERGEHDYANQIKQANDHPRGAAERTRTHAYLIDRDGQWWQLCGGGDQQLSATRGLDPPAAQNEGDALRGERNG